MPKYVHNTDKLHYSTFEYNGRSYMNLTLVNVVLAVCGDMHEQTLTFVLLGIQVVCSMIAFFIRYWMSGLLYN